MSRTHIAVWACGLVVAIGLNGCTGAPATTVATIVPPTAAPVPPTVPSSTTKPTIMPTVEPIFIPEPTLAPTVEPSSTPEPTLVPTVEPSSTPEPTLVPTVEPTAELTAEPTAIPAAQQDIVGYAGHIVAEGETLATIAANGGSTPELVARYNLLAGEPHLGRALVVPQLAGHASTLSNQPILVRQGSTSKPWVALTLDAGGGADGVSDILQTLRDRNVKLTFFLTGKWIRANPELARQIVADGHEIANHTFNHRDLTTQSDTNILKELSDTQAILLDTAGVSTTLLFRPPYGAYDERVLRVTQAAGYLPIYWTFDSLDSVGEPKSADFLTERVTTHLATDKLSGAIILMHCGFPTSAEALPRILDRFAEMGFEAKKLSEVLDN